MLLSSVQGIKAAELPTADLKMQFWHLDASYYHYTGCKCLGVSEALLLTCY